MNLNACLLNNLFKKSLKTPNKVQIANIFNRAVIGNREWVCFGQTGRAEYEDHPSYPMPSVRFKEFNNELLALREKEKGDWRKLSMDEKKTLYRASFRQTLAEVMAPTGQWKSVIGFGLILISVGMWIYIIERLFVYRPLPVTFSEEWRKAALRRMIDLKVMHLTGVSSRWDYEKDDWK